MQTYDVIVIGGGTAGLSTAVYACRANKKTLVIERETFGGQIVDSPLVENYPGIPNISGAQFASDLFDQAEASGAQFKFEAVTEVKHSADGVHTVVTDSGEYVARAVIVAAGCKHRHLGLDREQELIGSGVSYCALCDGAFFKDKTVAVVGGGNAALGDALYLSGVAKLVYLIHRRESFRADEKLVRHAEETENIKIITDATVSALNGTDELNGITINENGNKRDLATDGLFVAVGQVPDNGAFGVATDKSGYIVTDADCRTNISGVYAVGDCRVKNVRQLTTAAADGAIAVAAMLGDLF